jgi:hypothetical protein
MTFKLACAGCMIKAKKHTFYMLIRHISRQTDLSYFVYNSFYHIYVEIAIVFLLINIQKCAAFIMQNTQKPLKFNPLK